MGVLYLVQRISQEPIHLIVKIVDIGFTQREVLCDPLIGKAKPCGLNKGNEFVFAQTVDEDFGIKLVHVGIVPKWFDAVKALFQYPKVPDYRPEPHIQGVQYTWAYCNRNNPICGRYVQHPVEKEEQNPHPPGYCRGSPQGGRPLYGPHLADLGQGHSPLKGFHSPYQERE